MVFQSMWTTFCCLHLTSTPSHKKTTIIWPQLSRVALGPRDNEYKKETQLKEATLWVVEHFLLPPSLLWDRNYIDDECWEMVEFTHFNTMDEASGDLIQFWNMFFTSSTKLKQWFSKLGHNLAQFYVLFQGKIGFWGRKFKMDRSKN